MFYHAYKDERMAFSIMSLFIMTGYAIIIYVNQDDPQPRERDYSYVGSFFAFSVWIGVGTAAISEWISKNVKDSDLSKRLIVIALIMQILFVPTVMARANYHSHDRSGNFVAWDYSYNCFNLVSLMELYLQMEIMTHSHYGIYRKLRA